MVTKSTIVSDEDIENTKRNIRELVAHKAEAKLAIAAGIMDKTALDNIEAAIQKGLLFIKIYTGENYTPQ